ncbi:MAG: glycosyltransferase family 39 protein [Chloroflexi bacterium]|nr:glycosyltransferase family 39 protein [Chloroflexota bacterium]
MNVQTNSSTAISFSPAISLPRVWQRVALGAILVAAIFLHFYRLDQEGFANLYYAATVKSMLTSWHNFFFASFDPAGFVAVDKPPLGFWIQALSATLFGFNGISLLLPQALAGVLSVALIYFLVARVFGANAGLIAALVLTLTPISIASNRNNTVDSLLVFTSLLAAWAVTIAIEKGSARWLIVCAILVGIGFNIKELQAILVLPAFWFAYLVAANARWWKRIAHLFIATIILLIVSLAWVVAVDLTPRDQRPFVGSSQNNTEMELIVGHNGVQRLGIIANWLGLRDQPRAQTSPQSPLLLGEGEGDEVLPPPNSQPKQLFDAPPNPPANAQPKQPFDNPPNPSPNNPPPNAQNNLPRGPNDETGLAGAGRLFNSQLAGQTSWLLPLALIEFIAAAWQTRVRVPFAREHQQLLLWGMWLAPQIIFFSYAGLFHRYYLEMLSPAIAALVGAGMVALWRDYRAKKYRGWLLPIMIGASALVEILIVANSAEWARWLIPTIGALAIISALALVILKFKSDSRFVLLPFAFSTFALLIAPAAWSLTPVLNGGDVGLPYADPDLLARPNRPNNLPADNRLIDYLNAHRNGAKFLVATVNANSAAPIILETGAPVMAVGGFSGMDNILSVSEFAQRLAQNDVRYFLITPQNNQTNDVARWATEKCAAVNDFGLGGQRLYDCARIK